MIAARLRCRDRVARGSPPTGVHTWVGVTSRCQCLLCTDFTCPGWWPVGELAGLGEPGLTWGGGRSLGGSGPGSFRAWPQGPVAAPREGPMSSPAAHRTAHRDGAWSGLGGPVLGVGLGRGRSPRRRTSRSWLYQPTQAAVIFSRPPRVAMAWRLLSAKVVTATRNRLLQAQRKWTDRCLPDSFVTGVQPARAATESGPA